MPGRPNTQWKESAPSECRPRDVAEASRGPLSRVPVAQLDRASASGAEGYRFESCRGYFRHLVLARDGDSIGRQLCSLTASIGLANGCLALHGQIAAAPALFGCRVPGRFDDGPGRLVRQHLLCANLRLVLCTSERSLLSVILPMREARTLPERLREAVGQRLVQLGVPRTAAVAELDAMQRIQVARTASRRVLGSMNDFAHCCRCDIEMHGVADVGHLEQMLDGIPCGAMAYKNPQEVTLQRFLE